MVGCPGDSSRGTADTTTTDGSLAVDTSNLQNKIHTWYSSSSSMYSSSSSLSKFENLQSRKSVLKMCAMSKLNNCMHQHTSKYSVFLLDPTSDHKKHNNNVHTLQWQYVTLSMETSRQYTRADLHFWKNHGKHFSSQRAVTHMGRRKWDSLSTLSPRGPLLHEWKHRGCWCLGGTEATCIPHA